MKFKDYLNEADVSKWPLFDEVSKVEWASKQLNEKKFDDQRERALRKVLESEIDFSKDSDKVEAKKYAKLAKETIKKIENREGEYRFAFKISLEEQDKRYKKIWGVYEDRFSEKELEDIQYDAMMNVYHSLRSLYIGKYDIMETDDKEAWDIYMKPDLKQSLHQKTKKQNVKNQIKNGIMNLQLKLLALARLT